MYIDKDSRGVWSLHDLLEEDIKTIAFAISTLLLEYPTTLDCPRFRELQNQILSEIEK